MFENNIVVVAAERYSDLKDCVIVSVYPFCFLTRLVMNSQPIHFKKHYRGVKFCLGFSLFLFGRIRITFF